MFIFKQGPLTIIIPVYMDDKLLAGNDEEALNSIQNAIGSQFKVSNLGTVSWILGICVHHDIAKGTLFINQAQYIKSVLSCYHMTDCCPVSTPLPPHTTFEPTSTEEHAAVSSYPYLEVIGSLTYC